jgi:hypothetical protein
MKAVYCLHYRPSTERLAARLFSLAFEGTLAQALDGCDGIHYSGVGRDWGQGSPIAVTRTFSAVPPGLGMFLRGSQH